MSYLKEIFQLFKRAPEEDDLSTITVSASDIAVIPANSSMIFSAHKWDDVIFEDINCYSYALNIPAHGWGRPGQLLRLEPYKKSLNSEEYEAKNLNKLVEADGLIQVGIGDIDPASYHLIALACSKGDDFHFYRHDSDGTWSHKMGWDYPSDLDQSGNTIRSPETCDRGCYDFVGYFVVPEEGIRYTVDKNLSKLLPEEFVPDRVEP